MNALALASFGDPRYPSASNPGVDVWGRPIRGAQGHVANQNGAPNNWGFENPLWRALYQGNVTIENRPRSNGVVPAWYGSQLERQHGRRALTHEDVQLVDRDRYLQADDADLPTQDLGTTAFKGLGEQADMARIQYRLAQSIIVYGETPSPDANVALATMDPAQVALMNVPPTQATTAVPPVGGFISIGRLEFGHLGASEVVYYDLPPAQIVRAVFGGSAAKLEGLIVPKYWTNSDDVPGKLRKYLVFPGGPVLTSAIWNNLNANIALQNVVGALNPNKVAFTGWCAKADFPNTTETQPVRRFYGSILTNNVAGTMDVQCPVAWYASTVIMTTDPRLVFFVNTLTTGGGVVQRFGPFPANTPITMPVGATSITVHDPTGIGPAIAVLEVLFELDYRLSF